MFNGKKNDSFVLLNLWLMPFRSIGMLIPNVERWACWVGFVDRRTGQKTGVEEVGNDDDDSLKMQ